MFLRNMQAKEIFCSPIIYSCCLLWVQIALGIADQGNIIVAVVNASAGIPPNSTTAIPIGSITEKSKVDVLKSSLCKKCYCYSDEKLLDCSKKQMSDWFTDQEWEILQNGNILFETFKLDRNNLTTVPELPEYPLRNLYLGFNQITNITIGAFRNLRLLTKLDLSHNQLTSKVMVPDVFQGKYSPKAYLPLENIRELDLAYNELHYLHPDLFEHLPQLEVLILCQNTFQVINQPTEIAIASLSNLHILDMSYMELRDLPPTLLHGPRDLHTLILTGNLFRELPDGIELAINLKRLVLDENLIEKIEEENIFPFMPNLEYLSVSYLPELRIIGKGGLRNLQNLTNLVMASNPKLSEIDVMAFAKRSRTMANTFDYPPLEQLYLHNNNLSKFDGNLISSWDKVKEIDLRFNPWDCNCDNKWLISTLIPQINSSNPLMTLNVECASPAPWQSMSLINLSNRNYCNPDVNKSIVWVCLLIIVLVGIPLVIGAVVIHRRGCFGLRIQNHTGRSHLLYNRASFTDDI